MNAILMSTPKPKRIMPGGGLVPSHARVSAGVPDGGRFAPTGRTEPDLDLAGGPADYYSADHYTAERERDDALFAESKPYSYHAAADAEAHYLFQAGYTTSCSCTGCELKADAAVAPEEDVRWFDVDASTDEIEAMAQDLFRRSEAQRAAEFTPATEGPF